MTLCIVVLSVFSAVSGGQEEAVGHYEDALRAVFELQLDCHHHIQPYRSIKNGKVKWASIDLWPMHVGFHWLLPSLDVAHGLTSACT